MASIPWYTTRERVRAAIEFSVTEDALVDRAIGAGARTIDGETHRRFYPETATRFKDWPPRQTSRSWRLWLDQDELVSLTALTVAGTAEPITDYFLEPINDGPPFNRIEVDLGGDGAFSAGDTHQRAIEITGVFGWNDETTAAGTLAANIDDSVTSVSVTNGGLLGVGDLPTIDSERMFITEIDFVDTTINTNNTMSDSKADTTVPLASGDEAGFLAGETIQMDGGSEEMEITSTSDGNLNVKRAVNGTQLQSHASGVSILANRTLTVEREATGSTAASHTSGTAIVRQVYPSLIEQWNIAEATVQLAQETAAYARTAGSGDNERETVGRGLVDIRERAMTRYGRMFRTAVV